MRHVVVTGADGFIGRHFVAKCLEEKAVVWAIVHPNSENRNIYNNVDNIKVVFSEIEGLFKLKNLFPKEVDAFYHFAWSGVNANERDNYDCQNANIGMCLAAAKFAGELKAKKFIFPGSTSEYMYYGKPIDKLAVPSPQNAYGSAKIAARYMTQTYANEIGMDYIYVVLSGVYATDRRDNNVLFYTIDKLLKKEKPSLTKLEQLWDYVHIDDVVDGLFLVGEKGKTNGFYGIGKGDNQPLYKYINTIRNIIDPNLPLGIGDIPYKSNILPSSCTDLTSIKEDTGFCPKVEFAVGITAVINEMKDEIETNEKS